MRTATVMVLTAMAGVWLPPAFGQPPPGGKPRPDESREIVKEIEEAYKAPLEVHEDVRGELRKQYKNPTPERETKLFYEIRRLYRTDPASEQAILREVRRAYELQTPEQEQRLFAEIRRNETLPLGTVHPTTQADQGAKLFRRLDRDGDGVLSMDEMSETLRGQRGQWDKNRDGVIDAAEYGAFFESHHRTVAAGVASGEIAIRLPKGVPGPADAPTANRKGAKAGAPPVLPAWFADYDTDGDGQVGLYEWRRKGRTIAEFMPMDRNDDGYLTAKELLAFLADPANAAAVEKLPRSGK